MEAQPPPKRHREETHVENCHEDPKRQNYFPSNQTILSLLEDDDDYCEPNQDLSSILTALQQELYSTNSSDPLLCSNFETDPDGLMGGSATSDYGSGAHGHGHVLAVLHEEEREKLVMRHLLEASDDELGLSPREDGGEEGMDSGDCSTWCNGLWEIEDEAANYYSLLQSELFM